MPNSWDESDRKRSGRGRHRARRPHLQERQESGPVEAARPGPSQSLPAAETRRRGRRKLSPEERAYLEAEGLSFGMGSANRYRKALKAAGFVDITLTDRNAWYGQVAREERARLEGPLYAEVAKEVGADFVDKNIRTWTAMLKVLDSGEHRPTHLRAWKPGPGVDPADEEA